MLSVWRLQLLREVARRGTIAAAAAAMDVTPSAVSQQLNVLEREVGMPLLERVGRSVRLTDAGWLTVRHADSIAAALATAESELASIRSTVMGDLRIAAFPTAARAIMPSVMAALSRRYPALRLSLRDFEATESLAALRLGEVDVAIVDEYEDADVLRDPATERHLVLRDPVYLALALDHRPAGSRVSLADLADEFWVMDAEHSHLFETIRRACRAAGFEPRIRSHCKDFSVIIALIEAGLGVGVLPGLALRDRAVRARIIPFKPFLTRDVVAVINPERRAHPAVAMALAELDRFGQSENSAPVLSASSTGPRG